MSTDIQEANKVLESKSAVPLQNASDEADGAERLVETSCYQRELALYRELERVAVLSEN